MLSNIDDSDYQDGRNFFIWGIFKYQILTDETRVLFWLKDIARLVTLEPEKATAYHTADIHMRWLRKICSIMDHSTKRGGQPTSELFTMILCGPVYIHYTYTICSLYVHHMFAICLLSGHIFTICPPCNSRYVHNMLIHYVFSNAHYIFTMGSLYIHYMFTIR